MLTKVFKSILRILYKHKRKEGCRDDEKRCDALLYEAMDSEESEYSNSESNPSLTKFMQPTNKLYLPDKRDVKQHALFPDSFTQKNTKCLRNILSWILRNFVLWEKPNTIVIIYHTFVVTTII